MVVWVFDHCQMLEPLRRQTSPDVDRRVSFHPAKSVSTKTSKVWSPSAPVRQSYWWMSLGLPATYWQTLLSSAASSD